METNQNNADTCRANIALFYFSHLKQMTPGTNMEWLIGRFSTPFSRADEMRRLSPKLSGQDFAELNNLIAELNQATA